MRFDRTDVLESNLRVRRFSLLTLDIQKTVRR